MLKMLRFKSVFLVSLFVLCAVQGCFFQERSSQRPAFRRLVSPELLGHGRLEILWQNELPIKQGESLAELYILGDRIYGLSDRNYLVSLNRQDGTVVFSRSVASLGFTALGLQLYENEVVLIIGDKLVEINLESGEELYGKRLDFSVVCPSARNSSYYYLGGADRRMHVLRAEDKVHVFEVAAENDSMIISIVADDRYVVLGTEAGDVISIAPHRPKQLWSFNAAGAIIGPIVKYGNSLFFACRDTNVYKLNALTGELAWKYQSGAVLHKAPRVTPGVVYQYVRYRGLAAIDKKSGRFMWQLPEGVDLLAESDGEAYVITNAETLVVMDNKRAKQLYSVNLAGVSKYAANVADSKIYIADEFGRIACLKPIE